MKAEPQLDALGIGGLFAGQFLAAEALWTMDEQGLLGGVPVNVKLDVPKGWKTDPKDIHQHLVAEGALDDAAFEAHRNARSIAQFREESAAFGIKITATRCTPAA